MREQATSPVSGQSRSAIAPDPGAMRISGAIAPVSETSTSPSVTAEIPAVPVNPSYGVLLPDGTIWYAGSKRKLPAPPLLRVVVWILAFATLLAAAGVFIIRSHPSWVDPLRRMVTPAAAAAGTHHGGSAAHTGTTLAHGGQSVTNGVSMMSPQPAGIPPETTAYNVARNPYTIMVTANHLTWVGVWTLVNGQPTTVTQQETLQAGQTGQFPETGPVEINVGASLAKVVLTANGQTLGTVTQGTPWHFYFFPPSAAGSGTTAGG